MEFAGRKGSREANSALQLQHLASIYLTLIQGQLGRQSIDSYRTAEALRNFVSKAVVSSLDADRYMFLQSRMRMRMSTCQSVPNACFSLTRRSVFDLVAYIIPYRSAQSIPTRSMICVPRLSWE